jgi:dienelactone hydrolase
MNQTFFKSLTFIILSSFLQASDSLRYEIESLGTLTQVPKMHLAKGSRATDNPKAIYFDALPCKGKNTRSYAWLGLPKKTAGKVPGVVLVHGGGGTAYKEWVQHWNRNGFAAISIAVEGQTDRKVSKEGQKKAWEKHQWAGPSRVGVFGDSNKELKNQWMYHAVSQTILANSLLRSLAEVEDEQVGLMGVSWGGIISSIVLGIDQRFAFTIPVYGCGYLNEADNHYKPALSNNNVYLNGWDAGHRLSLATMPVLWLSWPGDKHFPMEILKKSYDQCGSENMVSLVPNMGHGHGPAWSRPESYAFAKSVLENGTIWCKRMESGVLKNQLFAKFKTDRELDSATLVHSTDDGYTGHRKWSETSIRLRKKDGIWLADWPLPESTTGWYVNVEADGLIVSSDYHSGS